MRTFASIFSGGELAGIGAVRAGLTPIWGVEKDTDIAAVAEQNVNSKVIVARAQDVDYSKLESPFWLHGSPQCINASQAKQDAGETSEDISQAGAFVSAIRALMPRRVSLENVWNYRNFESFQIICNELARLGYHFRYWHLNAANYGVPQTRRRLFLIASLDGMPARPPATHSNKSFGGLFEGLPRWVGWYEAIEDLIPTLPESEFADWQLNRLALIGTHLVTNQHEAPTGVPDRKPVAVPTDKPSPTVMASDHNKTRAFIAHPNADNDRFVVRDETEPIFTIKANGNGSPRAFIADSRNTRKAVLQRDIEQPAFTVVINDRPSHAQKAFIIDGKPANYAGELQIMNGDSPVVTVTASQDRHPFRAWLSHGHVVSMTVRANARFQSIPDSYILPESNKLASRIVGNAVPPLLMQRIVEANL